jgi:hypothetical protein
VDLGRVRLVRRVRVRRVAHLRKCAPAHRFYSLHHQGATLRSLPAVSAPKGYPDGPTVYDGGSWTGLATMARAGTGFLAPPEARHDAPTDDLVHQPPPYPAGPDSLDVSEQPGQPV